MKEYTKPEIKVSEIVNTDVITLSGGIVKGNFNKTGKGYSEVTF
jgi:hypothetical protein